MIEPRKTKIVCTIGPACWDPVTLKALAKAGMDVARLNFSHGTQEEKGEQIKLIRKISEELNKPIAILADLQGPKLRLGKLEGIMHIKKGDTLKLSDVPQADEIPVQFDLSPYVKQGQRIFLNDGLVELIVEEVKDKTVIAKAQNSGVISSNKGVNIPDTRLSGASFATKDKSDAQFALNAGVDYLALSFVQTPEDLKSARNLIEKSESKTRLMVKIEKAEAVNNLEEIIKLTDSVMVARGDLAIEMPATEVPIIQQKIIRIARQQHKPVVVATQMLESMIENPRPTRAEVSDVANAVLDQVDCVMLSAESASGKYPVEAVTVMKNTVLAVEQNPEFKHYIKINWETIAGEDLSLNAITSSAASLAFRINAKAIVIGTVSGRTARILSTFRPDAEIIAVVHNKQAYNQLGLIWGVDPIIVEPTKSIDEFIKDVTSTLSETKFFKSGDKAILVTGSTAGVSGTTNSIKVITI